MEGARKIQRGFKSDLSEIKIGRYKSQEQENALKRFEMLYNAPEKAVDIYGVYPAIVSDAKHSSFHEKGLKILTPKQMLQKLPIALAQVKTDNTTENLLN